MKHICINVSAGQAHQAMVLVRSVIDNGGVRCIVHITGDALSAQEKAALTAMSSDRVTVTLDESLKAAGAEADRLLVLRPGTLVLKALDDLFGIDLKGCPAAAVSYGTVPCDAVMLYDAAALRNAGWQTGRVNAKQLCALPLRWAYRPAEFHAAGDQRKIGQLNALYGTAYQSRKEMCLDTAIAVYDGACIPWEDPDTAMGYLWQHEALKLKPNPPAAEGCPVSVIIPCWNTEAWVRETLDSMLQQELPGIEIICMDDGSTDGTAGILREYAERDPRIIVYRNENHGAGWVRNEAIRLAKGKYIYFIDSDDLLEPGTLRRLYACAEENRLDLIFFEGKTFYDPPELQEKYASFEDRYSRTKAWPAIMTGKELFTGWVADRERWIVGCVMMMSRRELLLKHDIRFDSTIMYEDNLFYYQLCSAAERVLCLPDAFYLRRMRESSIMTGRKDPRKKAEAIAAVADCIAQLSRTDDNAYREALLIRYRRWLEGQDIDAFRKENPEVLQVAFAERVDSLLISDMLNERQEKLVEMGKQVKRLTMERDEARGLLRRPVRYAVRQFLNRFKK